MPNRLNNLLVQLLRTAPAATITAITNLILTTLKEHEVDHD